MTQPLVEHPLHSSSPYQGYVYAYPHKTAYRRLAPPRLLHDVWAAESRSQLFLYVHIPFCEQRCGFCNLFTSVAHDDQRFGRYLEALRRHAEATAEALGSDARFHRLAIGGGTPTILDADQLERLFRIVTEVMGVDPRLLPTSVEASPQTATADRLSVLRAFGVDRLSLGVQTFNEAESKLLGRTQRLADVHRALQTIRDLRFPTLNIDLIYGGDGQSAASWTATIAEALRYNPEELYLYPLYVRPCTGLAKLQRQWDDERLALYRLGRDRLLEAGYRQVSMRMFRRGDVTANDLPAPEYCCQDDGMVGLGCGARSYTRSLHYSSEYAVRRAGVLDILEGYMSRSVASLGMVDFGLELGRDEQVRRFVLKSLLRVAGLDRAHYFRRFGTDVFDDLPMLLELVDVGLATLDASTLSLTDAGLERSDAVGPWLCSADVRSRMAEYQWR